MIHHIITDKNHIDSRRPLSINIPTNNQIVQDAYDYEMKKLMERERRVRAVQQQRPRDNILAQPQNTPYVPPTTDEIYEYVQEPQAAPQLDRRLLPQTSAAVPSQSSPVKPLRIVIIRHAERADAVLGSDWSKKSFDRNGRYVRFSEHLPDALPTRSYLHHYVIDVPLTNRGRMHALKTGKTLFTNGYAADICYTSPSLRCVQSANGILTGMSRKSVPMRLEPCLFECYLNDFKRTLCFMTKDELATNGYNIDKSYQAFLPFMRPHDSQVDYYERCQTIMDIITERHQATGGTILIVAHAPSLEGLTRHLSGGKFQPEKLFDIARRVPFLAMTILEKNGINNPWLFRTRALQTQLIREEASASARPTTPVNVTGQNFLVNSKEQRSHYQQPPTTNHQNSPQIQPTTAYAQQNLPHIENQQYQTAPNGPFTIDLKKIVKSSTAPNLRVNNSRNEMFRVI
ncbi:unnamed protein product [Rotaria socialis]|uniref:Uncharacterized protein n=1 Tax=Rotaria socialis TaxID=392032 RepID=A0A818DHP0_9BILA|nr:unnamed protein product [Rotaria socialis]CAF3441673.1 unnamed protein product [Rotaria socialis]CAF3652606.1 unnamed protein product [Rotaria socialis]CAF3723943.1 unnamed protein product [Rotaria socialis]CAF4280529.1 unnamed protein product [Rotaria socialis]